MTLRKRLSTILIVIGFVIAIFGKFTLLFGVPFFLLGVILNFTTDRSCIAKIMWLVLPILLWMPMMMGFWYFKNKTVSQADTYIFPKGFRGQAIIVFGIKNGQNLKIVNGRRIFQFDSSGILLTKADVPKGLVDQKFYFKDNSDSLTPITLYPYVYHQKTKENSDSFTVQLFGWNELGSTKAKDYDYRFMNLKICSLAEIDTIDNGFKSWKMHDTIVARIR